MFGALVKYWQRLVLKCTRQPSNTKSGQAVIYYLNTEIGADNTGYLQNKEQEATNLKLRPGDHPRFLLNYLDELQSILTDSENSLYKTCGDKEWYFQRIMNMLKENIEWDVFRETQRTAFLNLVSSRSMR